MKRVAAQILSVVVLCASSGQLRAQKPAPPPQPDDFSFAGSWDCEGIFRGGKVHQSKFVGMTILDGKWLELTEEDIVPATGYKAKYLIGYDSQQKRFVEFDANNFGAAVYTSEAGWVEHVLTMTSTVDSDPKAAYALNRFVYTTTGKYSFTVDWQISRNGSAPEWVGADHLVCKRSLGR
jgi:hypothetical protein